MIRVLGVVLLCGAVSGCSLFSKGKVNATEVLNDFGGNAGLGDYRETQDALVSPLEIPPALSVPDDFSPKLAQVKGLPVMTPQRLEQVDLVKAEGVTIVQNDCARYALVEQPLETLWVNLTQFLNLLNLPVESSDATLGLMVTEFVERRNRVPKKAQPFLTELFNRASPKTAEDYFDKYRVRVEKDATQAQALRVYVTHEAMQELDSGTDWKQMPPEPERAAALLGQFVKFIALQQQALNAQSGQASGQ